MSNRLSKIYTRTGDDGRTSLGDGQRIAKSSARISALGTLDEANAALGVLRAQPLPSSIDALLATIQHHLFDIGGELCAPRFSTITDRQVHSLEQHLDFYNAELPPLKDFVLPAGNEATARCHMARTIVRRAERDVVTLALTESIRPELLRYLNRLSDLLFVLARVLTRIAGGKDILWQADIALPSSDPER